MLGSLPRELLFVLLAVLLQVGYRVGYERFVGPSTETSTPPGTMASEGEDPAGVKPATPPRPAPLDRATNAPVAEEADAVQAVEVHEFLSETCEGPAARFWRIEPSTPGTCLTIRPKMLTPGAGGNSRGLTPEVFHGRISCEELRRPNGGFIELCGDAACAPERCIRIPVMPEGRCGSSFTGFAGATWRCVAP
mmetsp:Transcript_84974/g.168673  ORF Transcript_84974/g.168673 Transcript_84974/m.168673 type:complete len:193 (+) Transcript_84974:89-667(+)